MKNDITPNIKIAKYRRMQREIIRRELIRDIATAIGFALLGVLVVWVLIVMVWAVN
jgi:hypothetical protein